MLLAALLNHAPLRHLLQPEGGEEEDMDKATGGGRGGGRGEGGGWQEIPVVVMNQAEVDADTSSSRPHTLVAEGLIH